MFGTHDLVLFMATALVVNATPGADMMFTLARTLQFGWRAGVAAALGIGAGCVVHTLAAALGLAALLAASSWAFDAIKWIGGAYLLWLAWGMARGAWQADGAAAAPAVAVATWRRVFVQGFVTNVLNPKVALFFLALLPQFIRADAPDKPLAFLFLGLVFVVNGVLFLFVFVAAAHRMRRLGARPAARRALNAVGATLFAALAARLVTAQR